MKWISSLFLFLSLAAAADDWSPVKKHLDEALSNRLFTGAALFVGDLQGARFESTVGSSSHHYFDIASLTKVIATATSVMILEERGELALSDKISSYFPDFKESSTIEDLLRHRAGFAAGATPLKDESLEAFIVRITKAPLQYRPRSKTVYSDLSFILLGRIVELISRKTLASFAEENIFRPLKMTQTFYQVPVSERALCFPTFEASECQVHDPTARKFLPASVGNAGVFSTIKDMARFVGMMLNRGELDGVRILSESTVKKMTTTDGSRGLGWDFTSEYSPAPRGEVFPAGVSFGHTGYTGTTIWIDPKSQSFYVFLSNRVFMGDERTSAPFKAFRKKLSTAIGQIIYGP